MSRIAWSPKRPQSIGEVLDAAFRIFQATLFKCLPYGLAAMLAAQAPNIHDLARGVPPRGFGANDPTWWLLYAAGTLATLMCWCAILMRQSSMLRGEALSARRELVHTLRRLPGIAVLFGASLFAIVLGLALLILPGVYLSVALALAWPAFVIEEQGALESLRASLRLTRRHWWHTTAVLTAGFMIVVVFVLGVTICAVALPFAGGADVALATALSAAVFILMGAIGAPFFGALLIATYGNLLVRREGFDLEQRLATLPQR
jgi:hypothetical protein